MANQIKDKMLNGIYFLFLGCIWILVILFRLRTCEIQIDKIITILVIIPGIVLLVIPFFWSDDLLNIDAIKSIKEITLKESPLIIFIFVLTWAPLLAQIFLKDIVAYIDIVLIIGGLFFGISISFLETGTSIRTVAFNHTNDVIKNNLNLIAQRMIDSVCFVHLGVQY